MTKEEREIFEYAQKKIVEMIERWEENRWSKAEIIDMLTAHKRDAIFTYPEPERTIWVDLYKKNIALRDGSFDQIYMGQKSDLTQQQTISQNETTRYTAKHYVLAYLIECNAKGECFPIGQKKELEKIGNKKMGAGKGNRFYKVFNELVNKDINAENNLIEIGGENWRAIVKDLSNEPEIIETYLQSKQL